MLGGGTVVAAGVGGEVGGTVVSATGVGAAVGVPVDAASAGVITAGGALAAGGAGLAVNGIQGLAHDTNQMFADSGNRYYPPPKSKNLPNVPGATRAKPKTPVQGGGGLRPRWKDPKGKIYEWDSQHGEIEKYNKRGKHEGVLDADTGESIPG